ncbi:hypothetical protein SAMN02745248_00996 [Hathewaya proteolytica DSM 3090]|uniref:Uncharacterized protein n=1 Tax=Hathewaya proteolytica DSM 3090 TaxID=1121331 RepID=A0A1M6MC18_9CLOT|nr:hypothetical protein [Hathewaya proteolytica]SHJ81068.1 hypothetical protein SAMN02745248_00996 [Hathewaya proteolytica DSM 3090]
MQEHGNKCFNGHVCLVNSKVVRADESNFKKVLGKSTIDINDQYKIQDENQEGLLNFFTAYFEKNLVP